jgi:hypothetical protein
VSLKAITLDPIPAMAVMAKLKRIETRGQPPAGDMCPPGVRPLPGCGVSRGERIAIHMADRRILGLRRGQTCRVGPLEFENDTPRGSPLQYLARGPSLAWPYRLPLGAVVATATLTGCARMVEVFDAENTTPDDLHPGYAELFISGDEPWRLDLAVWNGTDWDLTNVSDQLPFGDFAPGRWAWLLEDAKPTSERCPGQITRHCGCSDPVYCHRYTACPWCHGSNRSDPVPVKGRQGIWKWTP